MFAVVHTVNFNYSNLDDIVFSPENKFFLINCDLVKLLRTILVCSSKH